MAVNLVALNGMTTADLAELNTAIVKVLRQRYAARESDKVRQFNVGQKVAFDSKQGFTVYAVVTRLNTKTVSVRRVSKEGAPMIGQWRISPQLLMPVDD